MGIVLGAPLRGQWSRWNALFQAKLKGRGLLHVIDKKAGEDSIKARERREAAALKRLRKKLTYGSPNPKATGAEFDEETKDPTIKQERSQDQLELDEGAVDEILYQNVDESNFVQIHTCADACERYHRLREIHTGGSSRANVHLLRAQYNAITQATAGGDLFKYLESKKAAFDKWRLVDVHIDENEQCEQMLRGLSDDYQLEARLILRESTGNLTFDTLYPKLLTAHQELSLTTNARAPRQTVRKAGHDGDMAEVVKQVLKSLGINGNQIAHLANDAAGKPRCAHCRKPNHTEADCWKKDPTKRPQWVIDQDKWAAERRDKRDRQRANTVKEVARVARAPTITLTLDTGATSDMLGTAAPDKLHKALQRPREPTADKRGVHTAEDGVVLSVSAIGDLDLRVPTSLGGAPDATMELSDVLCVQGMDDNLKSIPKWCDRPGRRAVFEHDRAKLIQDDVMCAVAPRVGDLYLMQAQLATRPPDAEGSTDDDATVDMYSCDGPCKESAALSAELVQKFEASRVVRSAAMKHHVLLNHLGLDEMQRRVQQGRYVIADQEERSAVLAATLNSLSCVHCALSKIHAKAKTKAHNKPHRARSQLQPNVAVDAPEEEVPAGATVVASDICGPFPESKGKRNKWAIDFVIRTDGKRVKTLMAFAKSKSAAAATTKDMWPTIKTYLPEGAPVVFQTDRDKCYDVPALRDLYAKEGVTRRRTTRHSSWQNGLAERPWRTTEQDAVCLNLQANLPATYWQHAFEQSVHIRGAIDTATVANPILATDLHVYGCLAVAKRVGHRGSLSSRGDIFINLGRAWDTKDGYNLLSWDTHQVIVERNVTFFDDVMPASLDKLLRRAYLQEQEEQQAREKGKPVPSDHEQEEPDESLAGPRRSGRVTGRPTEVYYPGATEAAKQQDKSQHTARATIAQVLYKAKKTAAQLYGGQVPKYMRKAGIHEPKGITEALTIPIWAQAVEKENNNMIKSGTLVEGIPPPGTKIYNLTYVFKAKVDGNNELDLAKARLCFMGQTLKYDVKETFSPTVRTSTIRAFLADAASKKQHIMQGDVHGAYLLGDMPEKHMKWVRPPKGWPLKNPNAFLHMERPLYGDGVSGNLWYDKLKTFLNSQDYYGTDDPCLFVRRNEGSHGEVIVHVDDFMLKGENGEDERMMSKIQEQFDVEMKKDADYYLGMSIERLADGSCFVHQRAYVERVLESVFGDKVDSMNGAKTPMAEGYEDSYKEAGDDNPTDPCEYLRVQGALNYAACCTRPDIVFATNYLSGKCQQPLVKHAKMQKRVLRYLKATIDMGIKYKGGGNNQLIGWSDADYAGDKIDRKSFSGYLFKMGEGPVAWKSAKQKVVAQSTCESELIALNTAAKEAMWQAKIYRALKGQDGGSVTIFEDNTCAKITAETDKVTERTKHIAVRHFYVRDVVKNGDIAIASCKTGDMLADIFTKPLGTIKFAQLRERIGVCSLANCRF